MKKEVEEVVSFLSPDKENSKFAKKIWFLVVILLFFINSVSAELRINEAELNPPGSDSGNEWIELYSDSEINLTGWKIINHDNKILLLNQSFSGYLIINFDGQWLDNENESLKLSNDSLILFTPIMNDGFNDNRTWNYCNGSWKFLSSSKNYENKCYQPDANQTSNQTKPPENHPPNNTPVKPTISLDAYWEDDEIKNGEEFEIEINAFNLEDKEYDIKVNIYDDDKNKAISQIYNEEYKKWVSSTTYLKEFFEGPGDETRSIKLRIKDNYKDFYGDANINVRIRETGTSMYKKEYEETIEILKIENISDKNNNEEINKTKAQEKSQDKVLLEKIPVEEIILIGKTEEKAGTEDIKTNKNIVYQSKNELIKKYSIYFFAFLLAVFCVLLVLKKF